MISAPAASAIEAGSMLAQGSPASARAETNTTLVPQTSCAKTTRPFGHRTPLPP
jgi:hypothetical protein